MLPRLQYIGFLPNFYHTFTFDSVRNEAAFGRLVLNLAEFYERFKKLWSNVRLALISLKDPAFTSIHNTCHQI